MSKVTIIGAGMTGLCVAIFLKKRGYEVTVVEKNTWPGGIFASSIKKKYVFNSGLEFYFPHSWMLSLFSEIGENINDYITFDPLKNKYKTYLENNDPLQPMSILSLSNDPEYFRKTINHLESGPEAFDKFITKLGPLSEEFNNVFVTSSDSNTFEKFLLKNRINGDLSSYIKQYFSNPNTIAFLESFSLFYGDTADKVPAYYIFMLLDMIQKPMYTAQGGFTKIAEQLYFLGNKLGVKYWFGQEIESIKITDKKVTEVKIADTSALKIQKQLNSENKFEVPFQDNILSCDALIHTGDYEWFEKTVIVDSQYKNYDDKFWNKLDNTPSYSTFLVGLKDEIPALQEHCFIQGKNIEGDKLSYESSMYFTSTPRTDDALPTMKILSFQSCNAIANKDDNDKLLLNCIDRISKLTKINLSEYIDQYISFDPEDLKTQFLYANKSPYGMRHDLKNPTELLRSSNKNITNLFYATNSNYPGGNGLLSIVRARSLANKLIDEKS